VAVTDDATSAFHDQISRLFEDATGLKLPDDIGEGAFLGFILGLIAIEMEQGRTPIEVVSRDGRRELVAFNAAHVIDVSVPGA
jgi:hypothetical protein